MLEHLEISDLEKAVWQLENVCTDLKESRQNDLKDFSQNILNLHKETQRFMSHLDEYEKINAKIGPTIAHYIKESTENFSSSVSQKLSSLIEEKVNTSLQKLEKGVHQASLTLNHLKTAVTRRIIMLSLSFCLGSIITSLSAFWFIPFKFTPNVSSEMLYTYAQGIRLKEALTSLKDDDVKTLKKLLKMHS